MRIRTVKPEFWSHPIMCRLDDSARLLAIGLLNYADDEGFFFAHPASIRSAIWPFDEDSSKARRTIAQLVSAGWIQVREHPTHGPIGMVVNFTKHQRVDRPNLSKIKTYFFDECSTNDRRKIDDQSLPDQGSGIRDQVLDQGMAGEAQQQPTGGIITTDAIQDGTLARAFAVVEAGSPRAAIAEPSGKTFGDFRISHPLIYVAQGERPEWEASLREYGWEPMDDGYQTLVKTLDRSKGHKVLLGVLLEWIGKHYRKTDDKAKAS